MLHLDPLARALALVFVLVAAPAASAQLKLPQKPVEKSKPKSEEKPTGNVAPHSVCLVCGTRTYTAVTDGRKDEAGNELLWCDACKRDTAHRANVNTEPGIGPAPARAPQHGDLQLPRPKPKTPDAQPAPAAPVAPPEAAPATKSDGTQAGKSAATFVFDEVRKAKGVEDGLVPKAVETLISAGEPAAALARKELFSEEAPVVVVAARVLLRAGAEDDVELVKSRLRLKIAPSAVQPLLDELVRRDPVRVGPSFLAELLEHPVSTARQAAERVLKKTAGPELLPLLEPRLTSKRIDTRLCAVAIVAEINDPRATTLILDRIDDPSSKVAIAAINALAPRKEEGLDARLLSIAFRDRWVLRRGAYALITILEREDVHLTPVLDASHVEPLLAGMSSTEPFIAGTSAAALAGIGFRGRNVAATDWLDRDVPDRLVMTLSGKVYHDDFSALLPSAARRLALISGQSFGTDGPRWTDWWVGARGRFNARRAQLAIEPAEIGAVVVRCEITGEGAEMYTLVGADAAAKADSTISGGDIVYLTVAEMQEAVAAFQREGLLSAERLPGARGGHGRGERSLEITVNGRAKSFTLGPGTREPWFDRAVEACRALRDRNRWQRFPEVGRHPTSLALWKEQSEWWSAEHTDAERRARLKLLALASMARGAPAQRELATIEIERIYAEPNGAEAADYPLLMQALRKETSQGERTRRMARLALTAALSAGTDGHVPDVLAIELVDAYCTMFGTNANDALAEAFQVVNRDVVRKLASNERPMVRAVAAKSLAKEPTPEDVQTLVKLLDDPDHAVETAAASALGDNKIEAARVELLVRARVGRTPVRIAALEAIGHLGGQYVLEALIQGVTDKDPLVRLAAARGLAALADPGAAQVLISLLGESNDQALSDAARTGLMMMGEAAHVDLIRAVNAPGGSVRRESALLLAEQCQAEAASPLMSILTANSKDQRVAQELAILTCADMRGQPDPQAAWWNWWDGVRHDDALAWLRAASERLGVQPPPPGTLEGEGTAQGRLFLVALMARPESWLAERARREFRRLSGADPGNLPPIGAERDAWLRALREKVRERPTGG
jgi:HEAT repeat protein